jgi:hypothetical protein
MEGDGDSVLVLAQGTPLQKLLLGINSTAGIRKALSQLRHEKPSGISKVWRAWKSAREQVIRRREPQMLNPWGPRTRRPPYLDQLETYKGNSDAQNCNKPCVHVGLVVRLCELSHIHVLFPALKGKGQR